MVFWRRRDLALLSLCRVGCWLGEIQTTFAAKFIYLLDGVGLPSEYRPHYEACPIRT